MSFSFFRREPTGRRSLTFVGGVLTFTIFGINLLIVLAFALYRWWQGG